MRKRERARERESERERERERVRMRERERRKGPILNGMTESARVDVIVVGDASDSMGKKITS